MKKFVQDTSLDIGMQVDITVVHEQWMCVGKQGHTYNYIALYNLVTI